MRILTCSRCGKQFSVPNWRKTQTLCSRACFRGFHFPVAERFWKKVNSSDVSDACWPWTGTRLTTGMRYGRFTIGPGNQNRHVAHRIAWELTYGQISKGMSVLHKCDNPICCNPKHLFLGTHMDNMKDMISKGRHIGVVGRGIYPIEKHARGSKNGCAKLTESDVLEIRRLHIEEWSYRLIAKKFGISKPTVAHIIHRRTWTHI